MRQLALIRAEPDLVASARAGDALAFDELIGPHLETGYRTALAILRNPDAAQDAVQDAAFKAWRNLGQLREGASIRPWFLAIVANQCRSLRRTRWWSVLRVSNPEPAGATVGDALAANAMAANADLRRAIRRLRHRRRLLLVLRWYLDLPVPEIAAVTNSSQDAVKSELSRAVRQLRGLLREGGA